MARRSTLLKLSVARQNPRVFDAAHFAFCVALLQISFVTVIGYCCLGCHGDHSSAHSELWTERHPDRQTDFTRLTDSRKLLKQKTMSPWRESHQSSLFVTASEPAGAESLKTHRQQHVCVIQTADETEAEGCLITMETTNNFSGRHKLQTWYDFHFCRVTKVSKRVAPCCERGSLCLTRWCRHRYISPAASQIKQSSF